MEYLVFPFGKYKGTKLEDLPSTYIVLALEKFELPEELKQELKLIILGRLNCYSEVSVFIDSIPINTLKFHIDAWNEELKKCINKYEK